MLCRPRNDGFAIAKIDQPETDCASLLRLPIYARWPWMAGGMIESHNGDSVKSGPRTVVNPVLWQAHA